MSFPLPVPSKGALRTLRRIALGTSCTVAVGAGLITEDRRRRIHAAREIRTNARRIKGSRNYYGAGASVLATLEEQILDDAEIDSWQASERDMHPDHYSPDPSAYGSPKPTSKGPENTRQTTRLSLRPQLQDRQYKIFEKELNTRTQNTIQLPLLTPSYQSPNFDAKQHLLPTTLSRQDHLADHMIRKLRRKSTPETIKEVSTLFLKDYATVSKKLSVDEPLLNACVLLSRACEEHGMLDTFIPVLKILLDLGPIAERSFNELRPELYVARLLDRGTIATKFMFVEKVASLNEAASIFLAELKDKPRSMTPLMRDTGVRLCTASLRTGLWENVDSVYRRLSSCWDFIPSVDVVEALILANRGRGEHNQVAKDFLHIFSKLQPNQKQFYMVVGEVIQSACALRMQPVAEEILHVATEMAKSLNLFTSTSWLLRVLGQNWKVTRDLHSTQETFTRLEPFFTTASHPEAIYSAMVQFCIEDGKVTEAKKYLDTLLDIGNGKLDIRTSGHLALAKAMGNDWDGVVADFAIMMESAQELPSDYASMCAPIIKIYAQSHDIPQTEDFIRLFIEKFRLVPNQYILNIMVKVYANAKEMDSVAAWIKYLRPFGLEVNSVTFNTILSSCFHAWGATCDGLFQLCADVKAIDDTMVDTDSVNILRSAAIAKFKGDGEKFTNFMRLAECLAPSVVPEDKVLNLMNRALEEANPTKAVRIYKHALYNGQIMSPKVVSLAITACLQSTPDGKIEPAVELIVKSRERGLNTILALEPLALSQLAYIKDDPSRVASLVRDNIANLEDRGFKVPISVITTAANAFIDANENRRAVEFWFAMRDRYAIHDADLDIVSLTVLLKGFIALSDNVGIDWIMGVISQNDLTPDNRFRGILRNARKSVRQYVNKKPESIRAQRLLRVLDESVDLVTMKRGEGYAKQAAAQEKTILLMEEAALSNVPETRLPDTKAAILEPPNPKPVVQQMSWWKEVPNRKKKKGHISWKKDQATEMPWLKDEPNTRLASVPVGS